VASPASCARVACAWRRPQDELGDADADQTTWTFDGMRVSFNAAFATAAGIPTDDASDHRQFARHRASHRRQGAV
jgi:hypothetical protein